MSSCGVCPSVCLYVFITFVDSFKMNSCIVKFFHHRVATPFHTKRSDNISTGTPLTGASNAGGVAEIGILSQYLAASRAVNRSSGKYNTLSCDVS